MKCCLFGHRYINNPEKPESILKDILIDFILNYNVDEFYIGMQGNFDSLCTKVVSNLKKQYINIKSFLVLDHFKIFNDYEKEYIKENFDEIILPEIENTPPKISYIKKKSRNDKFL